MPKRERGVPEGFKLDVPKQVLNRAPVEPPDYLDEAVADKEPPPARHNPPAPALARTREPQRPEPTPQPAQVVPFRARDTRVGRRPARAQVNLTVDAQAMFAELMAHFSRYGVQKDLASSELFEALIASLYEAKGELDLASVPPRGQWGTSNARAFRTHLKRAVIEAIGRHYQKLPG